MKNNAYIKRNPIKTMFAFLLILIFIGSLMFKQYKACQAMLTPKNPQVISQSITNEKATLIWEKPDKYEDIVNYNIYENRQKIGDANNGDRVAKEYIDNFYKEDFNPDTVKISVHNYTATGLAPNTEYDFTIRSIDKNGKESADSQTIIVKTRELPKVFNIEDYGAKGDGITVNTEAIQKTVKECCENGEVLIPKGKIFKTGSIFLKSNITLRVEGTLLGSENPEDYPYGDTSKVNKALALIYTKSQAENIRIVGNGIIDGNGWKENKEEKGANGFFLSKESSFKKVLENGILAASQYKQAIEKYKFSPEDAYKTRSNLLEMSGVTNLYIGDAVFVKRVVV